jgi:hypothetical protein
MFTGNYGSTCHLKKQTDRWRDELIVALKEATKQTMRRQERRMSIAGRAKC